MFRAGFAREVITPARGVPLAGYFEPRPNLGVADELYVRAAVFESSGTVAGIVTFDLCAVAAETVRQIRQDLVLAGIPGGDKLIFNATHTHTAPYPSAFFGERPDRNYLAGVVAAAVRAIRRAHGGLAEAEVYVASAPVNDLGFNRRYWMKNGRVATNPGKGNPEVIEPEGPIDPEIAVVAFRQSGRLAALLVNLVNHTDTIGDDFVSADWPGRMERAIQRRAGYDVAVSTLIGASGNINHFDLADPTAQTDYAEACRIGEAYGEAVTGLLERLEKIQPEPLRGDSANFRYFRHEVGAGELAEAERVLAEAGDDDGGPMNSEAIVSGAAARFFARQLVECARNASGGELETELTVLKFGGDLAIAALPGEPFTEIGLALKEASPARQTLVATLAQGQIGYVCLPEAYERGGYENLPTAEGRVAADTAPKMRDAAIALLKK